MKSISLRFGYWAMASTLHALHRMLLNGHHKNAIQSMQRTSETTMNEINSEQTKKKNHSQLQLFATPKIKRIAKLCEFNYSCCCRRCCCCNCSLPLPRHGWDCGHPNWMSAIYQVPKPECAATRQCDQQQNYNDKKIDGLCACDMRLYMRADTHADTMNLHLRAGKLGPHCYCWLCTNWNQVRNGITLARFVPRRIAWHTRQPSCVAFLFAFVQCARQRHDAPDPVVSLIRSLDSCRINCLAYGWNEPRNGWSDVWSCGGFCPSDFLEFFLSDGFKVFVL